MQQAFQKHPEKDFVIEQTNEENEWEGFVMDLLKEPEPDFEPVKSTSPEILAWLYPDGETLSKKDMSESVAMTMKNPEFYGNVDKLISLKDYTRLEEMASQLQGELKAASASVCNALDIIGEIRQGANVPSHELWNACAHLDKALRSMQYGKP